MRNDISILPDGEHCESQMHGLFVARGIRADAAHRYMLISFAGDIIDKVPAASLHEVLYREVERSLR